MRKTNSAFTLLEIMMVMVVIASMATIISPWLLRKKPSSEWPFVLSEFNNLVYFARQEAIVNQKNYRLTFKSNADTSDLVIVESEEDNPENPDKKIYKQALSEYLSTEYKLPDQVKMHAFYKNGKEEFSQNKRIAYCYVVPDGLVEDVMILVNRYIEQEEFKATFKMVPFFGKFDFHTGFLKSERRAGLYV